MYPAFNSGLFSFITGLSVDELTKGSNKTRRKVIITTIVYVSGFSFVFILLGASASYVGGFLFQYAYILRYIGGGIIFVLGLHLLGLINIKALHFEKRIHLTQKPIHLFGVFVIGMAFGAGWSPCIGPMLGSILIVAGSKGTVLQGMLLLSVYSAGLALPFILLSFFISSIFEIMKRATRTLFYINKTAGGFLVVLGLLLITDKFRLLAGL